MKHIKWNDYGESSLTILSVYAKIDKENPTIPLDPSDFRRCVHLLECLNLNKKKEKLLLKRLAKKYPIWKDLVNNWDNIMKVYKKECKKESAPRLYKLLNK